MVQKKATLVRLENRLSYRCSLISTRITRFLAPMWEECYGLTAITWHVMAVIGRYSPLSAKEIAGYTSTDAFFVSRAVEQLVELGFVLRTTDPQDRRRARLELTSTGKTVHRNIEKSVNRLEAEFFEQIDDSQKQVLDEVLGIIDRKAQDLQQSGRSWKDFV